MPFWPSQQRKPSSGRWQRRASGRKQAVSVNMISLPLGDFRHLSHIGADGHTDSFGDLSFLREGHNLLHQSSRSEQNIFLACGPPPKPPRANPDDPGRCSPIWEHKRPNGRQKCSSLPLLDVEQDECLHAEPSISSRSPAHGSLSSRRDSTQTRPDQTRPDQTRPDQTRPDQTRPDQTRPDQTRPDQTRPDQTRPDQTRPEQRPEQTRPDQTRPEQTRPDQTRPDQTRPDQTRPDQTRPDQTRPDQTRPDQTRPDQTDSALTFSLDLGPSILEAVLQVMEQ